VTSVGGVGPFLVVERSKGWMLGGVSIFVCVCACVSLRGRVLFPVSSEGAKFSRVSVL